MRTYWLIKFGLVISFLLLFVTIMKLNFVKGEYYRKQARDNKLTETLVLAKRGKIVDVKGRIVAESIDENGNLRRKYNYGESLGVVTGYVGKANEQEMSLGKCGKKIHNKSLVGRGGIEEVMNCDLTGTDGKKLTEIDALGAENRELGVYDPVLGKDVELSIDAYWQQKMYELLAGRKAAAIVSEVGTGKIIVLASSPSFDPNIFSNEIDNDKIRQYLNDGEGLPMLNRAIGAKYHPGSVFKISMAAAGLEEGVITSTSTYNDTGEIKVGDYSFKNWLWTKSGQAEGSINIVHALKRSNDVYFYRLGENLGSDKIRSWANKFGMGIKSGIDLPSEVSGLMPNASWKESIKNEKWFLGDTYHMSIGQGDVSVSPLQINIETSIIANDGKKCQFSVLKNSAIDCKNIGIDNSTIETIKQGMVAACHTGGTAWPLFNFKTELACKTGTAEVGDGSNDTHAWLTAFAPANNPQIVITVLVERGGEGSDVAAPIVGDFLKEYFDEPNTLVPRYTTEISE
ncbi:MAG: penicillin-binding transpeptidase domain-containing protein [Candidatus Shapirobacteria bacterium]